MASVCNYSKEKRKIKRNYQESSSHSIYESSYIYDQNIKEEYYSHHISTTMKSETIYGNDRYIPNRTAMNMDFARHAFDKACNKDHQKDPTINKSSNPIDNTNHDNFKSFLKKQLYGTNHNDTKILAFKNRPPVIDNDELFNKPSFRPMNRHNHQNLYNKKLSITVTSGRYIPSVSSRILDAPDLIDDYYLNLLSWGHNNVLAVALSQTVYLWNADTGSISELMTCPGEEEYICSVAWMEEGHHERILIGTSESTIQLWDANVNKKIRTMNKTNPYSHKDRISSLAWNKKIFSSGSKDTSILHHDPRQKGDIINKLDGHAQEVCGLTWSPDGTMLASGGNDNTLNIFKGISTSSPTHTLTNHTAAVKALAWCPWERNLLASGGGTADRKINFWNARGGTLLNSIDTGSQVCSLVWSPNNNSREILSSHGYSENQLCLWSYPRMHKIKELKGHTARVLHMARSPDGSKIVSAAADENLRFWDIFEPIKLSKSTSKKLCNDPWKDTSNNIDGFHSTNYSLLHSIGIR